MHRTPRRISYEGASMRSTTSWPPDAAVAHASTVTQRRSGQSRSVWTTRTLAVLVLALVVVSGSVLPAADQASAQQDNRYFEETGFRIDNDRIWDYFSKRNGKRNFGLPTSRTFQFLGAPTQFFQRHVLQVQANGVKTLNLLDDGLLPYTTISGSTFPAVDQSVVGAAPKAGSATYTEDVATFLDK